MANTKDFDFNKELAKTPTGAAALAAQVAFLAASGAAKEAKKKAYIAAMETHMRTVVFPSPSPSPQR